MIATMTVGKFRSVWLPGSSTTTLYMPNGQTGARRADGLIIPGTYRSRLSDMERAFLEYGILGISVLILGGIVYKFILVRLLRESDDMKLELRDIQSRYHVLLNQQLSDYKEIIRTYNDLTMKTKSALNTASEVMESVLEKLDGGK